MNDPSPRDGEPDNDRSRQPNRPNDELPRSRDEAERERPRRDDYDDRRRRDDDYDDRDRPRSRRDDYDDRDRPRSRRDDYDDDRDYDDRPRRRRRYDDDYDRRRDPMDDAGMRMIMPIGVNAMAIISGYLGLISILLFPAPFALLTGILAVRQIRRDPKGHAMGRATFGIIMGGLFTIVLLIAVVALAIAAAKK
jgi:hypothetical protein